MPPPLLVRQAVPADATAVEALYRELVSNPAVRVTPERLSQLAQHCIFGRFGRRTQQVDRHIDRDANSGKLWYTRHFGQTHAVVLQQLTAGRNEHDAHGIGTMGPHGGGTGDGQGYGTGTGANRSGGSLESRKLGYLLWSDVIVPNKDELLYVAIQQAKAIIDAGLAGKPFVGTVVDPATGEIQVFELGDGRLVRRLFGHQGAVMVIASASERNLVVTGGVVSSLGKGMVSASIGALMENRGLRVFTPFWRRVQALGDPPRRRGKARGLVHAHPRDPPFDHRTGAG